MRILQLTGDWKWTGSAEPMLMLAQGLRARGHWGEVGCPEPPDESSTAGSNGVAARAREAGLAPLIELRPARGVRWLRDREDTRRLRAVLEEADIQLVHTWHTRDHVLALRAAAARRRTGRTRG